MKTSNLNLPSMTSSSLTIFQRWCITISIWHWWIHCTRWLSSIILIIWWSTPPAGVLIVTRPTAIDCSVTDTIPAFQPWLGSKNVTLHPQTPAKPGLERPTMKEWRIVLPRWQTLKVIIYLHHRVRCRRWCPEAPIATSAWQIIQCPPHQRHPSPCWAIVLCPKNVPSIQRDDFLKPKHNSIDKINIILLVITVTRIQIPTQRCIKYPRT